MSDEGKDKVSDEDKDKASHEDKDKVSDENEVSQLFKTGIKRYGTKTDFFTIFASVPFLSMLF